MLLVSLFIMSVATSDTVHVTLDAAIDYALTYNPEIEQLNIEYEKSKTNVGAARASFYPAVSATGSYAYLTDVPVFEIEGMPIPFGQHENYSFQVSLQQVIFAWGKLYNAYRISDIGMEIADLTLKRKKQEVRYSVTDAFYGILVLEETSALLRESLAQLERHTKAVEVRYKAGLVSQFDLLRAQVQVANLKPQVIEVENGLKLAREGFKMLLGLPLEDDVVLSGMLEKMDETFELDTLLESARSQRVELKNVRNAEIIARLGKEISSRANLPTLVAGATYERTKPFSIAGNDWGSNLVFNVGFQMPLFSGFKNLYHYREASLTLKQAHLALQNLEKGIALEVKQAYLKFLAAQEAIAAAEENVGQAEKAFEIIDTRYQSGLATNLEYLDAQLASMQARTNYFSALKDYYSARAEIYKAIGKEE